VRVDFEHSFAVAAPIEAVWAAVLDVERVAPCLPGAQVLERRGERAWSVALRVKLGPISTEYRGEIELAEQDAARHRAVLTGRARETRGQGTARGRAEIALSPEGGSTRAALRAELALAGRVASLARGLLQEAAAKLAGEFAANLAAQLAGAGEAGLVAAPGAAPREAGLRAAPLLASALAGRLRARAPLLAAAASGFLLGFLAGRC
jgi:hypothetical protein